MKEEGKKEIQGNHQSTFMSSSIFATWTWMLSTISLSGDTVGYLASSQTNLPSPKPFISPTKSKLFIKTHPKKSKFRFVTAIPLPREVGIYGNPIHRQRTTLNARCPLQVLNLAPDLMRHSLYERIWLRFPPNQHCSQRNETKNQNKLSEKSYKYLGEIITEGEQRIKGSHSEIGRVELHQDRMKNSKHKSYKSLKAGRLRVGEGITR